MATHQISIWGGPTFSPDSTGRCFPQVASALASWGGSAVWNGAAIVFNQPSTQTHGVYGSFTVPQNYVGTASIIAAWGSVATTGNCKNVFNYRDLSTGAWNQTSWQESVNATASPGGAAWGRVTTSISPTSANLVAGHSVEFYFTRTDAASGEMAAAQALFELLLQYADV